MRPRLFGRAANERAAGRSVGPVNGFAASTRERSAAAAIFRISFADRLHARDQGRKIREPLARAESLLRGEPGTRLHHSRLAGHDRFRQNARTAGTIKLRKVGTEHDVCTRKQGVVFAGLEKPVAADELDVRGIVFFQFLDRAAQNSRTFILVNSGLYDETQLSGLDVILEERLTSPGKS